MEVFQARLDSFLKAKRVKGSSGSILVKWPHPPHFPATPNTLAEAGFYSQPSWEERDAVKCFMCSKELSDWQEEDDPFTIHWQKCRTSCPWAILRCGLQNDLDQDGKYASNALLPSAPLNTLPASCLQIQRASQRPRTCAKLVSRHSHPGLMTLIHLTEPLPNV